MDTNQEDGVSLDDVSELLDEAPEQNDEVEAAEAEGLPEEGEQPEPEAEDDDELVEVEIKGKTYLIPKEVNSERLMHKDYTQKTQAVADKDRAVEARAQALEQREQALGASFEKAVEFRELQNKIAQFEGLDWNKLIDENPAHAQKLSLAHQQLQREAQAKYAELQQTHAQVQQLTAQQRQQMLAEAEKELHARLPNFGPQLAEKIGKAAQEYGISEEEINNLVDARHVHILHDAMKWRELQAKQPAAMKKVAEAAPAIKPQAAAQKPRTNQAAADRLKKNGRVEDLAAFL